MLERYDIYLIERSSSLDKEKIPLPLLILIISAAIGLFFCGIGGIRQMNAKKYK